MSSFFVIVPILSNYLQLHKSIQEWLTDIETKFSVEPWIHMHLRALYALCILFGSAFTAVEICNSHLFNLSLFNMGLNRRQKALFKNKRIFCTVLMEVKYFVFVFDCLLTNMIIPQKTQQ